MIKDIDKKSVSIKSIANKVIKDRNLLEDLLEYTLSNKAVIKYNSLKVLRLLRFLE